jgi:hypothetical protein
MVTSEQDTTVILTLYELEPAADETSVDATATGFVAESKQQQDAERGFGAFKEAAVEVIKEAMAR